ncbi:MAG: PTS sugar transporter subunit IIA [bacterium]|nr:PTS sugar transporter subunit IIA [bacterium]
MNLSRYMTEATVKLEMATEIEPLEEGASKVRWQQQVKEKVLDELISVLEAGNRVGNRTKLLIDYVNREKKATTGIGHGIAIPHIRSMQAKEFMMGFGRSTVGYDFDSLDQQPAHLFFIMAAPPYDDNFYLKAFKSLSEMLQFESVREELMQVNSPGEVIRIVRSFE